MPSFIHAHMFRSPSKACFAQVFAELSLQISLCSEAETWPCSQMPSTPVPMAIMLSMLSMVRPMCLSVQVSAAGRDNFLAAESDKTIALMIDCCSETKVATALLAQVQHKSPQVRAKVASHLDSLVQGEHGMRLAGVWPPARQAAPQVSLKLTAVNVDIMRAYSTLLISHCLQQSRQQTAVNVDM